MENAILVGISRQAVLERELGIIANNVANVNTTGFKRNSLLFQDFINPVTKADAFRKPDQPVHFVIDPRSITDHSAGELDRTGRELDVALQGEGYFVVQTPRGERFTRSGNFQLNNQGELVTTNGEQILGDGGPITFAANETQIGIGADGTISTNLGQRGRLRIERFAENVALTKEGNNLFAAPAGTRGEATTTTRVLQGAVERSNVRPVIEIGRLIEVTRSYVSISQIVDRAADLRRTAIQQLGNPNA